MGEFITVREHPEVSLFCSFLGPPDGIPLLVVHGGPDWDHSYLRQPLDRLGRRVILPDLRGCGRSTRGLGAGGYSFRAAADDLVILADRLGLDRFDLLGFSTGGQIAQRVLLSAPDRVRRTAIASSTLWPVTDADFGPWPERDVLRTTEARVWAESALTGPDLVREAAVAGAPASVRVPERLPAYLALLDRVSWSAEWVPGFLAGTLDSPRPPEGPERLRALGAPLLFLHGREDMTFPASFAERAAEFLPTAEAVVLEGAGHMAHLDRAEAWLGALDAFLSRP
ncbi:alpha/beta fold hydrolase [Nocardiopsis metallicus]|uniref:Pimeloyl-ACP methyl ester carboxylesterase n=1 Tax=Nocardiopsis metallicus TaxID=179819 RepID=A0A840WKK9_9ACTN|nr:alpha/beta hydrolase [Nocardiopsis metallicus]MBB5492385.1 pimeloyl-ACP methyl ester carboxylesterase [Nocardiopsis metallicus]